MTLFVAEGGPDAVLDPTKDLCRSLYHGLKKSDRDFSNIAVVPVDKTRSEGRSGDLVEYLYLNPGIKIGNIFVALGTHRPHSEEENVDMFSSQVPQELFVNHHVDRDVQRVGRLKTFELESICHSFGAEDIDLSVLGKKVGVDLNAQFIRGMWDKTYSCAISLGPVFPHEVVGFSNGDKNLFVGLGGREFIDASHYMMALYGTERTMGRIKTPLRTAMNYAHNQLISNLDIIYALTVIGADKQGDSVVRGLFIGDDEKEVHTKAAELSKEINLDKLDKPIDKAVVYLLPDEFTSFWVGNKAVYRTRMAMANKGTLYVIAPGIESFADNPEDTFRDELLASVGYRGTEHVKAELKRNESLRDNLSIAAHSIHASSEGRFRIVYLTDPDKMPQDRVEAAGFEWQDVRKLSEFNPKMPQGYQNIPGFGEVFYVPNPSMTLLTTKERFEAA
ncbi:MAG: lactate racemase domain-containing protein [Nanoarchaeota archaeon]|nr:lactate racemase domain-containing protein [Nanoarchaeota archaeon]